MYQEKAQDFLSKLRSVLGASGVLNSASEIVSYTQNVSSFQRDVAGVVLPQTVEEVQSCVRFANEFKVSLYPISSGKNWGMGSRLPVQSGCVILDLKNLNRIKKIDAEMGYATIEAGVTQAQLSAHLESIDCPYFLDVTGSSARTTIIGNAMERGISYNGLRAEHMLNLEIVLGTGEILRTGFPMPDGDKLNPLYRYGVGPSLDQLFFESSFGIVTSATVQLMPKQDCYLQFSLALPNADRVPDLFEALRKLREQHFLFCTARIANRYRLYPMLVPLLQAELVKLNAPAQPQDVAAIMEKFFKGEWFVAGTISGTCDYVAAARKAVRTQLRPFGAVRFMTRKKADIIGRVARILGIKKLVALFAAFRPLQDMACGIPTEKTIGSLFGALTMPVPADPAQEADGSKAGLLFSAPLAPLNRADIDLLIKTTHTICAQHQFKPAITLNTATDRVVEGVISLHFDKSDAQATMRAQTCLKELNAQLTKQGHCPYRLNVEEMGDVFASGKGEWRAIADLKNLFDPNAVIAPGRYCPPSKP